MAHDDLLDTFARWHTDSKNQRSVHDNRWAKNLQLIQGTFSDSEQATSKVRGRSSLFFRKIWATNWRLLASFYQAFLQDTDSFRINGRDAVNDYQKADILNTMVKFRKDKMMSEDSLFLKLIWAFQSIIDFGWAPAKFTWAYNPETGVDKPEFTLYPNEQVFPDFRAWTKEKMRYIIFENYLTKGQLEDNGYDNISKAVSEIIPDNILRQTRFNQTTDPLQNPGPNEYPEPGSFPQDTYKDIGRIYKVWEIFYREKGRVKLAVTNGKKVFFKEAAESPYGDEFPILMGTCLTKAFQLIGEGFPEPLEGFQESINDTINKRKDNVSLSLNVGAVVSRYANVDLQSLVNNRPGRIVLTDDPAAVVWERPPDVTQAAYMEAAADEQGMQEISGVTNIKQGRGKEQKATTSQINLAESNAKIDLFTAIAGETFVKDFFYRLARLIQRFETDEMVFRVANATFRKNDKAGVGEDVYQLDDFDFDCELEIGAGSAGRQVQVNQLMLAIQNANVSNQATAQLLQLGQAPPEGLTFINVAKIMEDLFPKIGQKNLQEYFFKMQPPPQQQGPAPIGAAGGSLPAVAAQGIGL